MTGSYAGDVCLSPCRTIDGCACTVSVVSVVVSFSCSYDLMIRWPEKVHVEVR